VALLQITDGLYLPVKDCKVNRVCKGLKAHRELREAKGQKAHKAFKAFQAWMGRQ
jgi:hypothetical protein